LKLMGEDRNAYGAWSSFAHSEFYRLFKLESLEPQISSNTPHYISLKQRRKARKAELAERMYGSHGRMKRQGYL